MRKLTWLLITLTVLWSGSWFAGSSFLRNGVETWFADQATQGRIVQTAGFSVLGFPNRYDLTLDGLKVSDPQTGFGWEGPFFQIFTMTWKPWHLIAVFPPGQTVRTPDQDIGLTAANLRASVRALPELALPLEEAVVEGTEVEATSTRGWVLGLARLVAAVRADHSQPASYDIGLNITGLAPDPVFVAAVQETTDLPVRIDLISANLNARLSAPLDRSAAEIQPHLTSLEVKEVTITWGSLSVLAKGRVEPDPDGFAAGKIEIAVTNWQHLVPILVAAGAVKPEVAPTLENFLKAMAQEGGSPYVLKLPLNFASGRMSLGPLPLGTAPTLVPPTN